MRASATTIYKNKGYTLFEQVSNLTLQIIDANNGQNLKAGQPVRILGSVFAGLLALANSPCVLSLATAILHRFAPVDIFMRSALTLSVKAGANSEKYWHFAKIPLSESMQQTESFRG